MPVIMNNSAIIPAPIVSIREEIQTTPDGTKIGLGYNLILTGDLVAWKGSPTSSGQTGAGWGGPNNAFWQNAGYPPDQSVAAPERLYAIEFKQDCLNRLFSTDGQWLEFQSPDSNAPLKCQPRLVGIDFAEGNWFDRCGYTITLNCDLLYLNGVPVQPNDKLSELVSNASESWQIEEGEVAKTYHLVHNCSATGKRRFDSSGNQTGFPWQDAKNFIQNRLVLGYNSTSSFSPLPGQYVVASGFAGSGSVINFANLQAYDIAISDTVDELAGTYSVTESWTLATPSSGTNVYSINIEKLSTEPNTTTNITVQGLIKGFYTQLGDYDGRFSAAQYTWNQLRGTNLYNLVSTYATGVVVNQYPLVANFEENPLEGTIQYTYKYSDRPQSGDVFDEYTIYKKNTIEDYRASVGIQGRITGRSYDSDTSDQRMIRSLTYWNILSVYPVIYNRVINSNAFPEISGLRTYPTTVDVNMDWSNGLINYTYEYNNRQNDNDQNDDSVKEDYVVGSSFSREEGRTIYTINGTITGLSITDIDPRTAKYNAANTYFQNITSSLLLTRVLNTFGPVIQNLNPISTTVEKNPTEGSVNYNYQYSNEPSPFLVGVLSEVIDVSEVNANGQINVFASIPVMGRVLGPVLQDMTTTKEKIRTINIETVVSPTGAATISGVLALRPNYDSVVAGAKPTAGTVYVDDDTNSWTWRNGRYTRTVRWIYQ